MKYVPKQKLIYYSLVVNLILPLLTAFCVPKIGLAENKSSGWLVKFKSKIDTKRVNSLLAEGGAPAIRQIRKLDVFEINTTKNVKKSVFEALKSNPNVAYIEPNYRANVFYTPNDPFHRPNQWYQDNTAQNIEAVVGKSDADIDARAAWNYTRGTRADGPVKIAILDTGVDQDHEDLADKIVLQKNFTTSPDEDDYYGHGTHVAGIAGAKTNNTTGIAGTCPDCLLLNGKVLDDEGGGYYSSIAEGIIWAVDNGAKVINMSFGGWSPSSTLKSAINYAWSKRIVMVAAAGNCGCGSKSYPAAYTAVISVASTNNKDKKSSFSSYGKSWVNVSAPGEDIYSTLPNHPNEIGENYDYLSGTSMSTPVTSGTAALIWASKYGTSGSPVRSRLLKTAQKISGTGSYWYYGRVNAYYAVR